MNISNNILDQLRSLGLTSDEARIYLELLRGPVTHLRLAQVTGINRTKVYRVIGQLEARSLVARQTDDRGTFLVAADPSTLEVEVVTQEEQLRERRQVLKQLAPVLENIREGKASDFTVLTYEGSVGFKQMLWHELKAEGEITIFGSGTIEALVPDRRWAEQHRARTVEAGYTVRELLNPGGKVENFTENKAFMENFSKKLLPESALFLQHQTCIYNDTVAIYNWQEEQKVGLEIINRAYAQMMRQIFEQYWQLAQQ